jgi:hypothetical protein
MQNNFSGLMYRFEPKIPVLDQLLEYIKKAKNKLQIIPDTILLPLSLEEINLKIDGFTLIYRKYIQNGHCWIGKV